MISVWWQTMLLFDICLNEQKSCICLCYISSWHYKNVRVTSRIFGDKLRTPWECQGVKTVFCRYLWPKLLKKISHICSSSAAFDICGDLTRIRAWYHCSRHSAFQQITHSWLWDIVLNWWIYFISKAFLLLTRIQEIKAGCVYVPCPNITNPRICHLHLSEMWHM